MKKPIKSLITMLLVISLLMSNIAMFASYAKLSKYPVELAFDNLFVFDKWANNTLSTTVIFPGDGTLETNVQDGSFRLTKTKMDAAEIYTAFSMDEENPAGNSSYYMIEVEPNTTYTFSYNVEGNIWVFTPYVFFYTAEGLFKGIDTGIVAYGTPGYGNNKFEFKTPADVTGIQIRFTIGDTSTIRPDMSSVYATVSDIVIRKTAESDSVNYPNRKVYTYGVDETYGELPVPTAPAGYSFAGWYTGLNGAGTHITANTPVHYSSFTVYPFFVENVDSLKISEYPAKRTYTTGETLNTTGLVLEATRNGETITIDSDYYCTPEKLTETGEQTITVHYGGQIAEFTVTVNDNKSNIIYINDKAVAVNSTNREYTFNTATGEFNRYEMTYISDAYVRGTMTYDDNTTEEFFLEPSSNFESGIGSFTSYIDGYLKKVVKADRTLDYVESITHNGIKSISFELLDNKSGNFELLSVNTSKKDDITNDTQQYFKNDKYKVGIDVLNGGVVSYLEVLNSDIVARVYNENGNKITRVDYANKLPGGYESESTEVNLINCYDTGRYLQQSYYGTGEKPYEQGYYNSADWNYNPVQGGNVANEASKVIDYAIGEDYIYVKVRPLDWSKWSDDFANKDSNDGYDPKYGEDYVTDTYVEAKYVFEDGMIKTYNRMVDYSGLPTAQTTQELPAFYTIEPLNHYVYNDVSNDDAWKTKNLKYDKEPEFWGITQDYISNIYPDGFNANHNTPEHWAAFTASADADSFGIGLYSPEVTNFFYGVYPPKYDGTSTNNTNYRHATTADPAGEDDSSYIAPVGVRTFESYKPTEYSYYISTGTVDEIRDSFGAVDNVTDTTSTSPADVIICVPETVYMTPSTGTSTVGQYYVNNVVDANGKVTVEPTASKNASVSIYAPGATAMSFTTQNVSNGNAGQAHFQYEGFYTFAAIKRDYGSGCQDKDYCYFNGSNGSTIDYGFNVNFDANARGLAANETAVIEWAITVYYGDNDKTGVTYYAYSTLYAPWYQPVGAATRADAGFHDTFASSILWVSGVHGYTDGDRGNSYYVQTANFLPILGTIKTPDNNNPDTNWIQSGRNGLSPTMSYTSYSTSNIGSNYYHVRANAISPTATLTVDASRYNNFNQIPNFKVGFMITDQGTTTTDDCAWYLSDYTGKTDGYNNSTDHDNSQFTTEFNYKGTVIKEATSGRGMGDPVYNGTWNKSISGTADFRIKSAVKSFYSAGITTTAWDNNFVNIHVTGVDKSDLRDLVLQATSLNEKNYTDDTLYSALQTAAQVLGDPTATAAKVTEAKNALETEMNKLKYNVVFDNLIDFSQWNTTTATNATISNVTAGGFTLTSNVSVGEGTSSSPYFTVTPGEQYKIDIDITGDGWDVYIFFWDENGDWVGFDDATSKYSSNGGNTTQIFTAPATATKAQIRVDANGPKNAVTFSNIRVYEVGTVADDVSYVLPITVQSGLQPESLPTPTRPGYEFVGWADASGKIVTADTITPSDSTVYLTSTWVVTPDNASDDTVVIEYGLPVKIDVRSNDNIKTGTVNAIGTGVTVPEISNEGYSESKITGASNTLTLKYGDATLNTDGTVTYTLNKTNVDAEDVFFYEVKEGNTYYYAKVTVIPATTLYYEDTFFTFTGSWTTDGTSVTDVFQDMDRAGESNVADDLNNVYGYDSSFDGKVSYSGGSAHYVEVDQSTGSNGPKATFTFTGTGFDLFTATDNKSGTFTTTIYRGTEVNSANRVKGIISNAYFGYKYNEDTETYEIADNGTIYQVPVISEHDLDYGTYTVVVEPRYSKAFDVTESGAYGVYVDSVRIYNPMGDNNPTANEAYMQDGEFAPKYLEIRDTLVTADTNGNFNIKEPEKNISVFIDGGSTLLKDYAMIGPKNEVYLAPGDAVAFNLVTDNGNLPSTIQIGMKLTGLGGDNASVALMKAFDSYLGETITLNSTTERYYNIKSVVEWEDLGNGTYKTKSPVVIFNTSSDAIISLTSIKWAFDSYIDSGSVTTLSLEADAQTPVMAMFAIRRVLDSDVQDDPQQTIPDTDNVETVEPAAPDDKTDDITDDSDSGSGIMGIDSFINALLTRLFNILKTVFDIIMGGVTA